MYFTTQYSTNNYSRGNYSAVHTKFEFTTVCYTEVQYGTHKYSRLHGSRVENSAVTGPTQGEILLKQILPELSLFPFTPTFLCLSQKHSSNVAHGFKSKEEEKNLKIYVQQYAIYQNFIIIIRFNNANIKTRTCIKITHFTLTLHTKFDLTCIRFSWYSRHEYYKYIVQCSYTIYIMKINVAVYQKIGLLYLMRS